MSQAISYISLRSLVSEQFWPHELFPMEQDGGNLLDEFALLESRFDAFGNGYAMSIQARLMRELDVPLPFLPGCALVMGGPSADDEADVIEVDFFVGQEEKSRFDIMLGEEDDVSLTADDWQVKLQLRCPAFRLRVDRDLLTPVKVEEKGGQLDVTELEGSVDIPLMNITVTVQYDGEDWSIALDKDDPEQGIDLPMCKIGESGVIVEAEDISFRLSGEGPKPEGAPDDWKGLYFEQIKVYLPEFMDGSITADGIGFGSGGLYGRITYNGHLTGHVMGMEGSISSVALAFEQSIPVESEIAGQIVLPFFDEPVQVGIGLGLDGDIYVSLRGTDEEGLFALEKAGILQAKVASLSFAREDGLWVTRLSGLIRPTMGDIDWPEFDVQELLIDAEGNVRVDGGWIDIPEKLGFDYYGFQAEATKVGFGSDEDDHGQYRWIGLSGAIKLADDLEIGGSVEGLTLKWWEDGTSDIELNGIGVAFEIPEVLSFSGEVAFLDGDGITGFKGDIDLDLPTLGVKMEAVLIIGRHERDATSFYYIFVDAELPAGIVLGPTGLALYGLSGLFAYNMEPNKRETEDWYGWYKRGVPGVTSTDKWQYERDSLALGAGMTVGTAADNGYMVSAKTSLAVILPGPIIMIQGKADFLEERTSHSGGSEGSFDALAVLDNRAGEFLMNIEALYRFDQAGRVLDIQAGAEAFFDYNQANNWHFYLGQKEPKEQRIQAKILSLFAAESYFMLEPGRLAFGYWQGFDERWKFGPVQVETAAWSEAHVDASVNPQQFWGKAGLHGDLDIGVYGFHFGFYLDAGIEVNTPSPFSILAHLSFGISLPWPLPDFDVKVELKWQEDGPVKVPPPLKEVAASHALTQQPILLKESRGAAPVVPMDAPMVMTFEKAMLDETDLTANPNPPEPLWQRIDFYAEKSDDAVRYEFQYKLKDVTLEHYQNGGWQPVSQPVHGVWLPQEGENGTPVQTKLMLFADNFMAAYRYAARSARDAFFENHPDYPCVPEYVKQIECVTFEDVSEGTVAHRMTHENVRFEALTSSGQWVSQNERLCLQNGQSRTLPAGLITLPQLADSVMLTFHLIYGGLTVTGYDGDMNVVARERFIPNGHAIHLDMEDVWLKGKGHKGADCASIRHLLLEMSPIKPPPGTEKILPEPSVEWEKICYVTCAEVEKVQTYDWHRDRQMQQLDQWFGEGRVFDPDTDYRIKIVTEVPQKRNDELQGNPDVYTDTYYFHTEGPPGYAPHLPQQSIKSPQADTEIVHTHPLQTLHRYVQRTIPNHGQKPFYRAYDVSVSWEEETQVPLMYRLANKDLGIYLFDSNGKQVADSAGHLLSWDRSWQQVTEGEWSRERQMLKEQLANSSCIRVQEHDAPELSTLDNGAEGRYLSANERYEARIQPIPLYDNFSRFDFEDWQVINEGNTDRPRDERKQWQIGKHEVNGTIIYRLEQTSNIHSKIDGAFDLPAARGTYLLYQAGKWRDQRITVRLSSGDDDAIGFMFGYRDPKHYYRFSMDRERQYRRLIKMAQGQPVVLAEDVFQYRQHQTYQVTAEVVQGTIQIYVDGQRVFRVHDPSFAEGQVALYCWGNDRAEFYDVMVEDLQADALSLYESNFVTSTYVNFYHHLHTFNHQVWPQNLPATGSPSTPASFEEAWPVPLLRPQQVTIDAVMDDHKAVGFLLQSPEPLAWERIKWEVEQSEQLHSIDRPGQVKLAEWIDRPFGSGLTLLMLEKTSLHGWRVEYKDAEKDGGWQPYYIFDGLDTFSKSHFTEADFTPSTLALLPRAATYLTERRDWETVRIDVDLSISDADDEAGILFDVQDDDNYSMLVLSNQGIMKLIRVERGKERTLWQLSGKSMNKYLYIREQMWKSLKLIHERRELKWPEAKRYLLQVIVEPGVLRCKLNGEHVAEIPYKAEKGGIGWCHLTGSRIGGKDGTAYHHLAVSEMTDDVHFAGQTVFVPMPLYDVTIDIEEKLDQLGAATVYHNPRLDHTLVRNINDEKDNPKEGQRTFRLVDPTGRVVHERDFDVAGTSTYTPLSMRCLPSEDGTAALFLCRPDQKIESKKTYRFAFQFLREKEQLPTLRQWGSKEPEHVTLDFVWS